MKNFDQWNEVNNDLMFDGDFTLPRNSAGRPEGNFNNNYTINSSNDASDSE